MNGEELRRRRGQLELNQSELARTLDVPVQTIARWERGEMPIRHGRILALALDALAREQEERGEIE